MRQSIRRFCASRRAGRAAGAALWCWLFLGLTSTRGADTENARANSPTPTQSPAPVLSSFTLDGHTAYHLRTAQHDARGNRAVITATYDGTVLAHSPAGELLWERNVNGHFPFDLAVADIDNDGRDEIFVATAGGTLDALSPDGRVLWSYATPGGSILYQVCPVRLPGGEWRILTGGIGEEILSLSSKGQLAARLPAGDVVRLMRKGNILGDGRELVALTTTSSARSGRLSLMLLDPADLKQLWRTTDLGKRSTGQARRRFFSLLVQDLDHDGADDIVLSGGNDENGIVYAFDRDGKNVFVKSDPRIPNISYRMNLLRPVRLPADEFILGHFGNVLTVYERDGSCREVLRSRFAAADAWFDPALRTLFLGSAISGGDDVYCLRLDQPGWKEAFTTLQPVGKLAQIEANIATLNTQLARFVPPAYQPALRNVEIISRAPEKAYQNLRFVDAVTYSQQVTSRQELWCRELDARRPYNLTADQIVDAIAAREAAGKDFIIWAGHGTAMHFPLSTFERALKAAPKHLRGFIFAELESVDAHMQAVVKEIVLPLAELCKAHGKVIIFRNKNVFWNGSCHLPFWKGILADGRYRDVIIPGMEESNSRTQELSLAGRIGLWQAGSFDRWLGRVTTDQANFDRMHEWGAQQVITHHLRTLVCAAAMGADIFYNTLEIADLSFEMEQDTSPQYAQLAPFYEMLAKGVIHIPRREELLSVSDLFLGIKSPPDAGYIAHGVNGHTYNFDAAKLSPMVFDRLDCYWGAAPLAAHDWSRYASGVERRMLNFLPKTPYGVIGIVSDDVTLRTLPRLKEKITTDGKAFYNGARPISPPDYQRTAINRLEQAAARLPVRVRGDVAWSVVRLDPRHVRVILIDSGYVDPAERKAEVILQHLNATRCTNILSGETLSVRDSSIQAIVPAGLFTVLDIEHQ